MSRSRLLLVDTTLRCFASFLRSKCNSGKALGMVDTVSRFASTSAAKNAAISHVDSFYKVTQIKKSGHGRLSVDPAGCAAAWTVGVARGQWVRPSGRKYATATIPMIAARHAHSTIEKRSVIGRMPAIVASRHAPRTHSTGRLSKYRSRAVRRGGS